MSLSSMIKPLTISLSLGALFFASCKPGAESAKPPIHPNPNMDTQEKYRALSESPFFEDGRTMRPIVEETVPYGKDGKLVQDPELRDGKTDSGEFVKTAPDFKSLGWTKSYAEYLQRGQQRYDIYCTPCHGSTGDGVGMVAKRGFLGVANLLLADYVNMPDGLIYSSIKHGSRSKIMLPYAVQIPNLSDRWAIVEYVRVLQKAAATEEYKSLSSKEAK
ncbi:c-type cytochrome [Lentisphaera profundi]|uniref:C-type cytochrome n=1 Tax=Lentisphaera profundi TaxID=1658616 RepID=A0ABY7VRU3_9BACT|nr:c-type cytochrome [Lentisphaera profundi]WDE96601.1 c-type cytochrome [Lentisphaera profundi]